MAVLFVFTLFIQLKLSIGIDPFIWPLPSSYIVSDTPSISLSNNFTISTNSSSKLILNAIERYKSIIFPHRVENKANTSDIVFNLNILIVDDNDTSLNYGVDESYSLIFPGVGILCNTVWGALRGLETFSQIVTYNFQSGHGYYQSYAVNITDSPRFKWRGVLIDTGRHYQSISTIKKLLDSMAYAKFNTLHWHMSDYNSFPFESTSAPKLIDGAFDPYSNGMRYEIYSPGDIKYLIQYAMERGIRIVVEFDYPSHASSWCIGYPSICPSANCRGILNPANNLTYEILTDLLTEVSSIFLDDYIHIGGDETSTNCWNNNTQIQEWEKENNFNDSTALLYMIEYAQNILYSLNKKAINWVDVFDEYSQSLNPNKTTIEVWKDQSTLQKVVEKGFNAILSSNVAWYLNYVDEIKGYNSWQTMYNVELFKNITSIEQQQLILGGEACLWGEYVDNSNVGNSIWPRAAAIAERLWSNKYVNNTQNAQPRYQYFRCLLMQRGIDAEPYNTSIPGQPPPHPGSCYDQRR